MLTHDNVSQQFYGSGGGASAGQQCQTVYVYNEETAELPLRIPLEGLLPVGSGASVSLNGLMLTPGEDYSMIVQGGVSVVDVALPVEQLETGDTFVASALVMG